MGKSFVNEVDLAGECYHPREVFFYCDNCKGLVRVTLGCGKRFASFCPDCAKRWKRRTFAKYYRGVLVMKHPKFLTLTLKKVKGRIEARLRSLWEMKKYLFKRLARLGYKIPSWCGVIEPPNHIHLILDACYIPQKLISSIWKEITGDSFIVDIRQVNGNDLRQVAAYITKYLTKASNWEGINLDYLAGFHLIGSWKLPPGPPPTAVCLCGIRALKRIDSDGFYCLYMHNEREIDRYLKDDALKITVVP